MNDSDFKDEQLEQLLRNTLTPVKPSWECEREILEQFILRDEAELRKRKYGTFFRYGWIGTLGVAAALLITFVYFTQLRTEPDTETSPGMLVPMQFGRANPNIASAEIMQYRTVGVSNKLVGAEDNGWTNSDEDSVTRELKYDYIDTVDFVNESDGSVMRMQIPRQEIVNVTYQVI